VKNKRVSASRESLRTRVDSGRKQTFARRTEKLNSRAGRLLVGKRREGETTAFTS